MDFFYFIPFSVCFYCLLSHAFAVLLQYASLFFNTTTAASVSDG